MPNYGVVDLGSNTIRLVVFDVKDDRKRSYTNRDFKSIINDKVMAGLAAHVDQDGVFTETGIARAIDVLKGHAKRARYFNCKRLDVFATAVLRNCANSDAAVAAIEEGTGLTITLLSAQDEAHLGFVGATCDRTVAHGTLIDIGGGSTELTSISANSDSHDVSIGQGSLSSFSAGVASILPTPAEMDAIEHSFLNHVHELKKPDAYRTSAFFGIGGSVRAAAKLYAQAFGGGFRPKTMTIGQLSEILDLCRSDPNSFAHFALKAAPERIHTMAPGCIIAHALMTEFGGETLDICKYGVREGYLIERMLG